MESFTSYRRSTSNAANPTLRAGLIEGIITPDTNLQSGDVIAVANIHVIVQAASPLHGFRQGFGQINWYGAIVNAIGELQRYTEEALPGGKIKTGWQTMKDQVYAFIEERPSSLEMEDEAGLRDVSFRVAQIPTWYGIERMDRLVFHGEPFRVDSIDPFSMQGVSRMFLTEDTRK